MVPLIVQLVATALALLPGLAGVEPLDGDRPALRIGLAAMFLLTASAHFAPGRRGDLVAMVPPRLPRPGLWVTLTGVLEIAGAVGLLVPATAVPAAACLAALLLAMFPANVSAARRGLSLSGRPVTPLPLRTVLQVFWIACCAAVAMA